MSPADSTRDSVSIASIEDVLSAEGHRLGYLPVVCVPINVPTRDPEAFAADLALAMAEVSPRDQPAVSAVACRDGGLIVYAWRALSAAEQAWLGSALADVTVGDSGRFAVRIPLVVNLLRPADPDRVRVCVLDTVETTPFADLCPPRSFVPDEGWYALFRALLLVGHPGCQPRDVVVTRYPLSYRVLAPWGMAPEQLAELWSGSPARLASIHPVGGGETVFELHAMPVVP